MSNLLAVDFGSTAIKAVALSGGKTKKLKNIGLEVIPHGTIIDGTIEDIGALESTFNKLISNMKVSTFALRVSFAVSGRSTMIKKVNFPDLENDDELSEQIMYEAEQHFQHDINDLYYDYCKLGTTNPDTKETPVLLVGVRKETIDQYLQILHFSKLRAAIIECDILSMINMFDFNYGTFPEPTIIIDVGATSSQITAICEGDYISSRNIPLAGIEYTKRISKSLNIDHLSAETFKIAASMGQPTPQEVISIITETNHQLATEIKNSLDFLSDSQDPRILNGFKSAFVSGGGSHILGLISSISTLLGYPVSQINPFNNVAINQRRYQPSFFETQGHLYGTSIGLALRSKGDR